MNPPGIPVKSMLKDENGAGKTIWSLGAIKERSLSPSNGSSSNHSGMRRTNSGRKTSSGTIIYTSEGKSQGKKSEIQIAFEEARKRAEKQERKKQDPITELHNLTEADLEAMYESPGIPVKSMLEDENGEGKTVWGIGDRKKRSASYRHGSSSDHSGTRRSNGSRSTSENIIYTSEGKSQGRNLKYRTDAVTFRAAHKPNRSPA